jgi:hypothetical protein
MCGTLLEARSELRRPAGAPVPNLPKIANAAQPLRPPVNENAAQPAASHAPLSGGPSVAGFNQLGVNRQPRTSQSSPDQPSPIRPSMSSLGESSFSGMDSFSFEPEQSPEQSKPSSKPSPSTPSKTGALRILLLVALLAALGVAGWWTYTNYLGAAGTRKPDAATSAAGEASAGKPKPTSESAAQNAPPAIAAKSSQPAAPSAATAGNQAGNPPQTLSPAPKPAAKTAPAKTETKPKAAEKPAAPAKMKIDAANKSATKGGAIAPASKPSNPPAPAADTGDAAFRKGEAYLYGRGAPENCDEAVKYLKAASAKSNARARSAFGTMYATGHCVPRDLPTSYSWFALALRADPNNQILEKDLSAVWNQMTPPERQMATKTKR